MKTNGTRTVFYVGLFLLISLLITLTGLAQPDYDFRNPTLTSGTDKQIGAKYRYKNVRPGVDAFVTITDIRKVTLSEFDGTTGGGYVEAFQPVIFCPAKTNGYVEFRFDFVKANTTTPMVMTKIPVTAIDIDGYINPDEKVYEYDEFDLSLGYLIDYNLLSTSLTISVTGLKVQALNKNAVDYSGIDTVRRDVMFNMSYSNVSSITIRAGVDNKSKTDITRLRSDYFKTFSFPHSFLAKPVFDGFRGNERNKKVELQWELNNETKLASVTVERATNPSQFQAISEIRFDGENTQKSFSYNDNTTINGQAYYRLKVVTLTGTVQYSNILVFRTNSANQNTFNVFPTAIQSTATVSVKAEKSGKGKFQLVDYAGRVVAQQDITVQQGANNIVVNNLGNLNTGNYIALVKLDNNETYNQKVIKQ